MMAPLRSMVSSYIGGGWGKETRSDKYPIQGGVIRGTDIPDLLDGKTDGIPCRFHAAANFRSRKLEPGDIVFEVSGGSKGQPVGRALLVREDLLHDLGGEVIPASFCKRITPNRKLVEPLFLSYVLCSLYNSRRVVQWQVQSTGISNFKFEDFLDQCKIQLPGLSKQRHIASILSTYDALIENNHRRIQILEEMARALYREWFVNFRFPGHEKIKLVPSSLGDIPQGWEVKKLLSVAEVNRAQINARNAPDELHYIDISSVSPGQIDSITTYAFADAPGRARRIVQHGDVLWSCVRPNRRSHALVMYPEENTIASTGFAVLTTKTVPFTFLYAATTTDGFVGYLTNNASGAAYPAVTAAIFKKAELLVPPLAFLKRFGDATTPIAEQAHILRRQITNLRRTRDLLLPRLLSGEFVLDNVHLTANS